MPIALLAALAASVITHVTALFVPTDIEWLPHTDETPPPLTAELQMPAAPSKAPKLPKPAKQPPRTPPSAPAPADVASGEAAPAATSATPAAPVALPPPPSNSPSGRIRYRVYQGTNGFMIGESIYQWQFQDDHYTLSSQVKTAGLAGLLYPIQLDMRSEGLFGPAGLQPQRFSTLKNGQPTDENAEFNWDTRTLRLTRDGRERPLVTGSQDLLSFHFQLAYQAGQFAGQQATFPMSVASGKRYDSFQFTVQGEETLETPAGNFKTLHLRASAPSAGADATEVWLAADQQWLAVKIRFTDRKGELFEQVIQTLETNAQ